MRVHLIVASDIGAPRSLVVDAPNEAAARQQAQTQGYVVLSAKSVGVAGLWQGIATGKRLTTANTDVPSAPKTGKGTWNLVVFTEQLRDLLQAGLSVIEALNTLKRGSPDTATHVLIQQLSQRLSEGLSLSAAMSADTAFPPLLIALVRASELTSDLPQSLTRFIDHEQRVIELRHRITSTALYPLLLIGVGGLVLLFLLFYVMPRFARIFESLSGDLPWSARAMVGWSHLLAGNQAIVLTGLAVLFAGLAAALAVPSVRSPLLSHILQWGPLRFVREPLAVYHLARWYRAVGMLVLGGIPLPQALRLTGELLPANLQDQGRAVEQAVNQGMSPSSAYVHARMATPVAEQLLRAAERTGDLGTVLERIAQFHENDVSRSLERGMKVLEPLVMLFIGLGVGIVVVLMYMPIFELASSIQ